jgi:hypothetical protein
MRELLTLQFGSYANFVGTHYWNQQQSLYTPFPETIREDVDIDHRVLFRQGISQNNLETFTPRVIIVDSKGNSKLHKEGPLYQPDYRRENTNCSTWDGQVNLYQEKAFTKNEFFLNPYEPVDFAVKRYKINEEITWTDLSKVQFHRKSMAHYSGVNSEDQLSSFFQGVELYTNQFKEELENKARFFAEECDHLMGVQVWADTDDCTGGLLTASMTDFLDEYSKRPVAIFSLNHPHRAPTEVFWILYYCLIVE